MKRIAAALLTFFALCLGAPTCLATQDILTADRFLDRVSTSLAHDQAEQNQFLMVDQQLNTASQPEVERVLSSIVQHTRSSNELDVRMYAEGFLLAIALRPDTADLLSSNAAEIAALLIDTDPTIQSAAVAIMDYIIAKPRSNNRPYLSALSVAIDKPQTPQKVAAEMIQPLLYLGYLASSSPEAVKSALTFLHRDDLTIDTRVAILHGLANENTYDPAGEIATYLCKEFDAPEPRVRIAAVIAYSNALQQDAVLHSTSAFHRLAKAHVEKMANDPQENPKIRELAKDALAGKTGLNPNILDPNVITPADLPKAQP